MKGRQLKAGRFSASQIRHLKSLGVLDEQIARLQRALPAAARELSPKARVSDVKELIQGLASNVVAAVQSIERVSGRRADDPAALEAYERLNFRVQKPGEPVDDGEALDEASRALERLLTLCRRAQSDGGRSQTRSSSGSSKPVEILYRALADGWSDAHSDAALMPEEFGYSGTKVKEVMAICFQHLTGKQDYEPERAVKAFIKRMRTQRQG